MIINLQCLNLSTSAHLLFSAHFSAAPRLAVIKKTFWLFNRNEQIWSATNNSQTRDLKGDFLLLLEPLIKSHYSPGQNPSLLQFFGTWSSPFIVFYLIFRRLEIRPNWKRIFHGHLTSSSRYSELWPGPKLEILKLRPRIYISFTFWQTIEHRKSPIKYSNDMVFFIPRGLGILWASPA